MKCLFAVFLFFFFIFAARAQAALVNLTEERQVVWNVLSAEDASGEFVVKKTLTGQEASKISLVKEGEQVLLFASSGGAERVADVTGYTREIVEVEHKEAPSVIKIYANEDSFQIDQGGVVAVTRFPIYIDTDSREFSIRTNSGEHFLSVLPREVFNSLIRLKVITSLGGDGSFEITEGGLGELSYVVKGKRKIEVLNIAEFDVPVTASVSAATGQLIKINQPVWLSVLGFMFG